MDLPSKYKMSNPFGRIVTYKSYCTVETEDDVAAMCMAILGASRYVCIDCEWTTHTRLSMVQFFVPGRPAYLVRVSNPNITNSASAKSCIRHVLQFSGIVKVFHDCREDVTRLYEWCTACTYPVFDLQVCSQLLKEHRRIGYAELVRTYVNKFFQKARGAGRDIWDAIVLHPIQCHYCAQDVTYASDVYIKMLVKIDGKFGTCGKELWEIILEESWKLTHSDWIKSPNCNVSDADKHPDRVW